MTDTYSIEDFSLAFNEVHSQIGEGSRVSGEEMRERIIAELTKPEWQPEDGQVYWYPPDDEGDTGYEIGKEGSHYAHSLRPLTQQEVGSDWIPAKDNWAIDALKGIASYEIPRGKRITESIAIKALSEHGIKI